LIVCNSSDLLSADNDGLGAMSNHRFRQSTADATPAAGTEEDFSFEEIILKDLVCRYSSHVYTLEKEG
jgi:hypothetical protein